MFPLTKVHSQAFSEKEEYEKVYSEAGDTAKELLGELGVSEADMNELLNVSFFKLLELIIEIFKGRLKLPFSTVLLSISVMLVFSAVNSFSDNKIKKDEHYSFVFSSVVLLTFVIPLAKSISTAISAVKLLSDFMLSYIPIFTSIASVSGKSASSLVYSTGVIAFANVLQTAAAFLPLPIMIMLVLNIHFSCNKSLSFERTQSTLKKAVNIFLSVSAAVFVGFINLKTGLAKSADSLAIKGIKLASGSVIPIIGNSVGESIGSVLGSLEIIHNTVGVFGIAVLFLTVIPSITEMLIWYFCMLFLSFTAEISGMKAVVKMSEGIMSVISIINVIVIYSALVFILTTGNLLSLRG